MESKKNIWHDKSEVPEWNDGDNTGNQIIVYGETRTGKGCSIGSMIADGVIYAPVAKKEYKWGDCPFEKWAYVSDILPKDI